MPAEEVSQPEFEWKLEKNILIPMSDGINLASDAYRPVGDGRYPAIIGYYGPYHKDLNTGGFAMSQLYDIGVYFAKRGYRVFFVDVRGTGNSEGNTDRLYSEQEQRDSYEVVEWLARQPWCNGNVGMYGVSYGFYSTVLCAATTPPHLKAIVPFSGAVDWFSAGWGYEGGNLSGLHFTGTYAPWMIGMNYMPPEYHDPEGRWVRIWQEHLQKNIPWFLAWFENDVDGPYYEVASVARKYDRVKAATLVINGWHDYYPSWPIAFFQNIKVPKKLIAGPWMHELPDRARPGPRIDILHEMLRWYDHWLKGNTTGVMDEPPVSMYVQEYTHPDELRHPVDSYQRGRWRLEEEFPPRGTYRKPLYLHGDGFLSWEAPTEEGGDKFRYDPSAGLALGLNGGVYDPVGLPINQRYEDPLCLTYATKPLEEGIEIAGQPRIVVHASSSTDNTTFVAKLCDQAPDGTAVLVSRWSLNAAFRESSSKPSLLRPGEVYELKFDLHAVSYYFEKGHQIKLYIASSDFPFLWPTPKLAVNTIYRGSSRSRVELPIVPPRSNPRIPNFLPPPPASSLAEVSEPTYWRLARDMGTNTVSVEWGNALKYRTDPDTVVEQENRLLQTVNIAKPALSKVNSSARFTLKKPNVTIDTLGKVRISSDGAGFHVLASVEISYDGSPYVRRDWTNFYPRKFR